MSDAVDEVGFQGRMVQSLPIAMLLFEPAAVSGAPNPANVLIVEDQGLTFRWIGRCGRVRGSAMMLDITSE